MFERKQLTALALALGASTAPTPHPYGFGNVQRTQMEASLRTTLQGAGHPEEVVEALVASSLESMQPRNASTEFGKKLRGTLGNLTGAGLVPLCQIGIGSVR